MFFLPIIYEGKTVTMIYLQRFLCDNVKGITISEKKGENRLYNQM